MSFVRHGCLNTSFLRYGCLKDVSGTSFCPLGKLKIFFKNESHQMIDHNPTNTRCLKDLFCTLWMSQRRPRNVICPLGKLRIFYKNKRHQMITTLQTRDV